MVAVRPKERWYLYGDDAALADHWLRRDLDHAQTAAERAWLLKHWPSLGGFDAAERGWCKGAGALEHVPGRAACCVYCNTVVIPILVGHDAQSVEASFLDLCQSTMHVNKALQSFGWGAV